MKILYICNEYPPIKHGGIGTFTKELCEKLVSFGHQVAVVGYSTEHSEKSQEEINGVSIFRLPLQQSKKEWHLLRLWHSYTERRNLLKYVNEICQQFHPDIVETNEWNAPVISLPCEGQFVVRLHGGHGMNALSGTKKACYSTVFWEKRILGLTHNIIAVSSHIMERSVLYYHLKENDISVIFNGVDTNRFTPFQDTNVDCDKLLYVGRIVPPKGLDCLFGVLDKVFEVFPKVHLELAGGCENKYKNKLLSMVSSEYHARINFLGRLQNEQLPQLYSSAKLCVFPSFMEAFSVAVLEAMACGTPVVYSNLPSVKGEQVVSEGIDGFLCNPKNKDELFRAICFGLKANDSMRLASRHKAEIFSWNEIIKQNIEYYNKILEKTSSNG